MSDLWRDMDFALPAGHPSTWELECKQLRVKLQEAESAVNWADMTKNRAVDECKQLRARVAELEAALREIVYETTHLSPEEDDGSHWCKISGECLAQSRAALKGGDT